MKILSGVIDYSLSFLYFAAKDGLIWSTVMSSWTILEILQMKTGGCIQSKLVHGLYSILKELLRYVLRLNISLCSQIRVLSFVAASLEKKTTLSIPK